MLRQIKMLILSLAVALLAAGPGWAAAAAPPKPQTTCPVLGGNIDKKIFADYKGKRIYFCCPGCDEAFKNDPEKYMKKLEEQGVTPEDAPAGAQKK